MAPSQHDWKIVDWDVKPQHNQPTVITDPTKKLLPIEFPVKTTHRVPSENYP